MIRFVLAVLLTTICVMIFSGIAYYVESSPERIAIASILFLHFWSALKD